MLFGLDQPPRGRNRILPRVIVAGNRLLFTGSQALKAWRLTT